MVLVIWALVKYVLQHPFYLVLYALVQAKFRLNHKFLIAKKLQFYAMRFAEITYPIT